MFYTVKLSACLMVWTLATLSTGQYGGHYPSHKDTFRPSPVDDYANAFYNQHGENQQDSGLDYYMKPPSFQPVRDFYVNDFNNYYGPPAASPPTKPLFEPATHPYPAETAGQVDNYNQALREEAEELAKQQNQAFYDEYFRDDEYAAHDSGLGGGKSYVNVKFGGDHATRYHYTV